jgi:hypothetical protein
MLSNNQLFDLISECFDPERMKVAVLDEIAGMIDYDDLAEAVISEHEAEISGLIAEMAEDALR